MDAKIARNFQANVSDIQVLDHDLALSNTSVYILESSKAPTGMKLDWNHDYRGIFRIKCLWKSPEPSGWCSHMKILVRHQEQTDKLCNNEDDASVVLKPNQSISISIVILQRDFFKSRSHHPRCYIWATDSGNIPVNI